MRGEGLVPVDFREFRHDTSSSASLAIHCIIAHMSRPSLRWRRAATVAAGAVAAGAVAAYIIYHLWMQEKEEEEDFEPEPERPPRRRPSFSVTDEHKNDRGVLHDARAHQWGWLVDSKPLEPATRPIVQPALRRRRRRSTSAELDSGLPSSDAGSEAEDSLGAKVGSPKPERKSVKFCLDRTAGFYGFVFNYKSGMCVAHGADQRFVGKTLSEVLELTSNHEVDGEALHERFKQAAEVGGDWVSYAWRNDSTQKLQHKGAWISKVTQWGQEFYAGVGYALVPPAAQPPQPDSHAHGMYGFVCTADGLLLAHGASPAFVGRTLAEVLEATANTSIDQPTLLKRFHAAARLGGGWVTYPWRLSRNAPLRTKGCFVTRLAAQQGAGPASSSSSSESELKRQTGGSTGGAQGSDSTESETGTGEGVSRSLLRPVPTYARGTLYAGVGYFESESPNTQSSTEVLHGGSTAPPPPPPPAVPPSPAAAKAAAAVLKELLNRARLSASVSHEGASIEDPALGPQLAKLQHLVSDATGELAAATAEVTCWQSTEMPVELRELLREHAMSHLRAHKA